MKVDVIISCGQNMEKKIPDKLPDNIKAYPYVDQLDILSKADVFITHCGMNSVSESLYMAAPMVLYPQTNEQAAVARRVTEINTGILLQTDTVAGIKAAVEEILGNASYAQNAEACSKDFRNCPGTAGAAEFIENAPHPSAGRDLLAELHIQSGKAQGIYWAIAAILMIPVGLLIGWRFVWMIGVAAGVLSYPIGQIMQRKIYQKITGTLGENHA